MKEKEKKPFMVRKPKEEKQEVKETKKTKTEKAKKEINEPKKVSKVSEKKEKTAKEPEKKVKKQVKEKPKKKQVKEVKVVEEKKTSRDNIVANKRNVNEDVIVIEEIDVKSKLEKHKDNKDVLYGRVIGVDIDESQRNTAIITLLYEEANVRVLIPDTAYFEPTFNFGENYDRLSAQEKVEKRIKCARLNLGSICPFIVMGVAQKEITIGNYAGEKEVYAVGCRTLAMEKLRDKYFIHSETKEPVSVFINDQANANIIQVSENYVTIECLGVETRIDSYNLNERHVENCADFVSVGDKITVRIKKVRINGKEVYLKVSGRLNLGSRMIESIKVDGSYLGEVESYNKGNKIYTCKLYSGVNVSVPETSVQGHIELNVGDRVAVVIKEIKQEGYAYGLARKI